jgi:hypothetical protein
MRFLIQQAKTVNLIGIASEIRNIPGEIANEIILEHRDFSEGFSEGNTNDLFFDFYDYFLSRLGISQFVHPKFVVRIYGKTKEESWTSIAHNVLDIVIDTKSPLYETLQAFALPKEKEKDEDGKIFDILNPDSLLTIESAKTDQIATLFDLVGIKFGNSNDNNAFFNSLQLKQLEEYFLELKLANLPPFFFLPAFKRHLIKKSFRSPIAENMKKLNEPFVINSVLGSDEYFMTCITCVRKLKNGEDSFFACIRNYNNEWVLYSPHECEHTKVPPVPFDITRNSEALLTSISDEVVGVWYMRKIIFHQYQDYYALKLSKENDE